MSRRGMTLIEVVAALALMAVLVTSVVPLLVGAQRVVREPRPAVDLAQVVEAADALAETWAELGLVVEGPPTTWHWRYGEREIELDVRLRTIADDGAPRARLAALVVAHDGVAATRFVALPEEKTP